MSTLRTFPSLFPVISIREYLKNTSVIAKSTAQCRASRRRRGRRKGEVKFEGVMWHGGMTNQLLVVQLGPHTQHQYYRDHYLSSVTPLPQQRRQIEGEMTRGESRRVAWCALTNSPAGYDVAATHEDWAWFSFLCVPRIYVIYGCTYIYVIDRNIALCVFVTQSYKCASTVHLLVAITCY